MRISGVKIAASVALVVLVTAGVTAVVRSEQPSADEPLAPVRSLAPSVASGEPSGEGESEAEAEADKVAAISPDAPTRISAPQPLLVPLGGSRTGDLRKLPYVRPTLTPELAEPGEPALIRQPPRPAEPAPAAAAPSPPTRTAPAPAALTSFVGLDLMTWGSGWPPDTNGDVGPTHFIQSVNASVGIFDKATGTRLVASTFDTLTPNTSGTPCDNDNAGDPVVVWDSFSDRWILTDFAFTQDGGGNLTSPTYECVLVSKTSDPVDVSPAGGWWYFAVPVSDTGVMADYPKVGVWPDGIYITFSMFGAGFTNVKVLALNRSDLESGATLRTVAFDLPVSHGGFTVFSALPGNARVQTGTPPAGRSELIAQIYGGPIKIWKFTPDWVTLSSSTLTGPSNVSTGTRSFTDETVPTPGPAPLDALDERLMMQAQYANIGGAESLWLTHTGDAIGGVNAPRWYQVGVTGGNIASTTVQAATYPTLDTIERWMPSLAIDKLGDMALGYSAGNATTNPSIRYSARLASDPAGTLSLTEREIQSGAGHQTSIGGTPIERWGDYSTMTLDPDGCTFWFTTEYYAADGYDWQTRIASLLLPGCSTTKLLSVAAIGPSGAGSVTSDVAGISCGASGAGCTLDSLSGASVVLTAAPSAFATFTGWSGACSGSSLTCSLTMSQAKNVWATFAAISFQLDVATTGTGTGAVTSVPSGLSCSPTCTQAFAGGTSVTLTATAAAGSSFTSWTGACTGSATTCTLTMSAAQATTATFTLTPAAPVDTGGGGGSGTPAPVTPPAAPPALKVTVSISGTTATLVGSVPAAATAIVQTATLTSTKTGLRKQVKGRCLIKGKGKSRTYQCKLKLSKGTWRVVTQAKQGATVVAETTRSVRIR